MKLSDYKITECSCDKCKQMCLRRPCWGTPKEIENIIKAGFGDRLMIDYWKEGFDFSNDFEPEDTKILSPAIKGYEKEMAPTKPLGKCTFLTTDGRCELHEHGLKPLTGKLAICDPLALETKNALSIHEEVAKTWRAKSAQKLVKIFEEKI
jgi:hypothetical protein